MPRYLLPFSTGSDRWGYPMRDEFKVGGVCEQDQSIDAPEFITAGYYKRVDAVSIPDWQYGIAVGVSRV